MGFLCPITFNFADIIFSPGVIVLRNTIKEWKVQKVATLLYYPFIYHKKYKKILREKAELKIHSKLSYAKKDIVFSTIRQQQWERFRMDALKQI